MVWIEFVFEGRVFLVLRVFGEVRVVGVFWSVFERREWVLGRGGEVCFRFFCVLGGEGESVLFWAEERLCGLVFFYRSFFDLGLGRG